MTKYFNKTQTPTQITENSAAPIGIKLDDTGSQGMLSLLDSGNSRADLFSSHPEADSSTWILDFGATNHMTFDANDFSHTFPPRCTSIVNANGVVSSVTGAGTVTLSPSLTLSNTLLVPSLSHKLLSVNQVTTYLNCIVLIYPTFCLL